MSKQNSGLLSKSYHLRDRNILADHLAKYMDIPTVVLQMILYGDENLSFYLQDDFMDWTVMCYIIDFKIYINQHTKTLTQLSNHRFHTVRYYSTILTKIFDLEVTLYNRLTIERNINKIVKIDLVFKERNVQVLQIIIERLKPNFDALIIITEDTEIQQMIYKLGGRCFRNLPFQDFGINVRYSFEIWYLILN